VVFLPKYNTLHRLQPFLQKAQSHVQAARNCIKASLSTSSSLSIHCIFFLPTPFSFLSSSHIFALS
jgi:hypothetical protein